MRVLLLVPAFPRNARDYSGIFVKSLAEALHDKVTALGILTPADAEDEPGEPIPGVTVHRCRYFFRRWELFFYRPAGGLPQRFRRFSPVLFLFPLALLALSWQALRLTRRYDVVHCHWIPTALFALVPCLLWRKALVVSARGSDMALMRRSRVGRAVMRRVLRRADAIICVSRDYEQFLAGTAPELRARLHHVPNGVGRLAASGPRPQDPHCLRVLFIGNMTREKGLPELQYAVDRVGGDNGAVRLTLVGEDPPPSERWFWDWLDSRGDRVHRLGIVPHEQALALMGEHDLLVLPSHAEGRPNVVLEAMANGLPVVASNLPGIGELVRDGREGLLVPPGDRQKLAEALRWCLSHRAELEGFAPAARSRIDELGLTWDNCAARHLGLYRECVESLAS